MKTFAEYYAELLRREGQKHLDLISTWDRNLIGKIKKDFKAAAQLTTVKGLKFEVRKDSSNQSIGNQIADHIAPALNIGLRVFTIENCPGSGYPDRFLARGNIKNIALEMKATSNWKGKSNRTVLTSSSVKLRKKFEPPIYHLLCTVIYSISEWTVTVGSLRLDFLEPTSNVNIRFEASVDQQILINSAHESILI